MSDEPKPLNIKIDTGNIQAVMKRMAEIECENKTLQEQVNKNLVEKEVAKAQLQKEHEAELDKNGGKGTLPANLNPPEFGNDGLKEFNSFPELVDYYRENEPERYKQLFAKGIIALHEHPASFEVKDDFKDGKSCIQRTLEAQNKQWRGKINVGHS
jgi:hypothetical protein